MKGKPIQFDESKLCKANMLKPNFSPPGMENSSLKAGSGIFSEVFQFKIQIIFP